MTATIGGVHHVTAIASEPQPTIDFYIGVLGLRLVKKTVNFDDPETYHFYFGDRTGRPGTILTFFPIPLAHRGQVGAGQATPTGLSVPRASISHWADRLDRHGVRTEPAVTRFGDPVLPFYDPDGLRLELVGNAARAPGEPWEESPVPAEMQVRGVHHVQLNERAHEPTATLLTETLGFRLAESSGNLFRYRLPGDGPTTLVDVLVTPEAAAGRVASGTVHHVAFRVPDDAAQNAWRERLIGLGYNVSPVMDRNYFRSIYFREPGGVLFELATDVPGFTVDEPVQTLGTALKLPSWYESARQELERRLPAFRLPGEGPRE